MSYSEILYEVKGAVARVTLNRPEKRNPLGPTTIGELLHALERAQTDEAVRVIVLTGAGKAFSAGGDLSSMGSGGTPLQATGGTATKPGTFVDLNLALTRVGKPTIAMVNGHALAGGLGLVVACDVAIAADDAQLGTPEINVGLWPMMIMANIFRNVPRKRGLELIMTGDKISAAQAAEMGLITRAVPRERLEEEVEALAQKLASKSPVVMRLGLEAFYRVQDMELAPALQYLQGQLVAVLGTEDAREGLMAFMEKRAPQWKGK
jgi:enoyl-CoA hydratase/carnithine racemase